MPHRAHLAIATLGLILAGCNRDLTPQGQVVAVVNGEEITTAELNEEARARSLPIGSSRSTRDQLVQELINRKLLVQAARQQKLDRSPQHLLAVRRLSELALAQQALAAQGASAASAASVSREQLEALIKGRPHAFAQRFLVSVDRINVSSGIPPQVARAINSAGSTDQMVEIARRAGLRPARATEMWDSGTLPDALSTRLAGLKPRATFALVQPEGVVAGQVITITPQPVPESQRVQVARAMIEQQASQARLQSITGQLRSKARIDVQAEFNSATTAAK